MATTNPGRGNGIFDHALMFLSSGNLTKGTSASSVLHIRGTHQRGSSIRMVFPNSPATTWKVLPQLYGSVDNSTFRLVSTYPNGPYSNAKSTAGEIQWEFALPRGIPYVKLQFTHTGGTTGSSFGAVKAGIVPRGLGEWHRQVRWG
jgi:hypothetical protein